MSLLKLFTVYDSKAECYLAPFTFKSKGEAIRAFTETINDGKSTFSKYPADFTLFELGDFHEESAQFGIHATPISLGVAVEFLRYGVVE